ncbi:LuxR family transcriptional regulator [Actinomadura soli]|uniref:LuxR family transcriptional regulator n=2 Tax=Actinomadura soli TaxID=2508997 RepID=A0A5C4J452_9ACTN|nr:LuxR family transcriptional regulator [Actinomadura soli]
MARMAGAIIERDLELGVLAAAVRGLRAGSAAGGSIVLVTGEAGIGKTSLVRAFQESHRDGLRVLVGACDDLMAPCGLGPLREAACGTGGPLERALGGARPREEVFAAAAAEFGGPDPAVLIVEDVHWADDGTLDVLRYLARRLVVLRVVIVLTFRNEVLGAGHPLQELLGGLGGVAVRRVPLRPLSPAAVRTLAEGTGRDGAAVHELTGGNPFYVTEALAVPPEEIPETVSDAVLARLRRLGDACRSALEQLSVVPTYVGFALAEGLFGSRLDVLAEAEERGILLVRDEGLAFRHELARRAIAQSVPALRRREFNRAVVAVLREQESPDLDRLVHHAVEADDVAVILAFAPEAGRRAARAGSRRQAIVHYEAALRHAGELSLRERAALVDDYAWELYNTHRYPEAVIAGSEAVTLYEGLGDPVLLGEALVRLSRHIFMTGRTEEAEAAVVRAVGVLEDAESPSALAQAHANHGAFLALTERAEEAIELLRQTRQEATDAGRTDVVALCANYLGMAATEVYGPDGGLRLLRGSLALAKGGGHHEYTARAYTNLGELLYRFGRYDDLDLSLEEGLAFVDDHGFWSHAYNLEAHRCLLQMRRGDWKAAREGLRRLVEDAGDPGMLFLYSVPPYARLLARCGDEQAGSLLGEAWARARRHRSLLGLAYAGIAYVEWAWLAGVPEAADQVRNVLLPRTERQGAAPLRAELLRYLARIDAGGTGFPGCPEPYASGLRGDWQRAAAAWRRIGDPYETALELAEAKQPGPVLEALDILRGLGATAAAGKVRARLRALGVTRLPRGPAVATRTHPAGLTERQADVLRLLAQGLTNAEIADRLVVSVRTVDHHVSAILGKLGVRSRREAAALHGAQGEVPRPGVPGLWTSGIGTSGDPIPASTRIGGRRQNKDSHKIE